MRIVVVYESVFGNTHRIASAIELGARQAASTRLVSVGDRASDDVADADILVLGGPTHAFAMSTPGSRSEAVAWTRDPKRHLALDGGEPTGGIREWLDGETLLPPRFATFDTRVQSMRHLPGSAARSADRRLRALGITRLAPPTSFYVSSDNELLPGEEDRARAWGEQLARASIAPASVH
jgi:hypothetical protein